MATTYPQWEYDLLSKLGAPANGVTLQALSLWAASEGTAANKNNPLAVCCTSAGSNGVIAPNNGYPVYSYGTEAAGVNATATAIQGYPGIVAALRKGTSLYSIFTTINASKWCSGCQSGNYPVALFKAVNRVTGGSTGSVGQLTAQAAALGGCNAKGGIGPSIFGAQLTYCQLKSWTAAGAIIIGGVTMGLGVILIAAFGLTGSKAGRQATALAARAPGPVGRAAKGVRAVGSGRAPAAKVKAPVAVKESATPTPVGRHTARDDTAQRARHAPGQGGVSRKEEAEMMRQANEAASIRRSHSVAERAESRRREQTSQLRKQRAG